jgi:hypothetical protein
VTNIGVEGRQAHRQLTRTVRKYEHHFLESLEVITPFRRRHWRKEYADFRFSLCSGCCFDSRDLCLEALGRDLFVF